MQKHFVVKNEQNNLNKRNSYCELGITILPRRSTKNHSVLEKSVYYDEEIVFGT